MKPIKQIIKEYFDDLKWIHDIGPEIIDLNDKNHVKTIQVGDVLEISGEKDSINFKNEQCRVICIDSCSTINSDRYNAWDSLIMVSFNKEFISKFDPSIRTHCGNGITTVDDCNCQDLDRHYGTCWWVHLPEMDKVLRHNY